MGMIGTMGFSPIPFAGIQTLVLGLPWFTEGFFLFFWGHSVQRFVFGLRPTFTFTTAQRFARAGRGQVCDCWKTILFRGGRAVVLANNRAFFLPLRLFRGAF